MNEITSNQTLIGTLRKSFDLATITGNLKLKRMYLLNLINKFMYCCGSNITFNQKQHLQNLVIALQNLDKNICIYREQRSIYTNIVGCKNCKNLNNSPYLVINTAPEIDEPDPIEPLIKPIVCDISFNYLRGMYGIPLNLNTFVKCFNYLGNVESYSKLKIISLPEFGVLYDFEGNILNINDEVDLTDPEFLLKYIYTSDTYPNTDTFEFQISTNETSPEVFSETYTSTINIQLT